MWMNPFICQHLMLSAYNGGVGGKFTIFGKLPFYFTFISHQDELEEMRGAVEAADVLGQELEEKEKRIDELTKEGRCLLYCTCVRIVPCL